MELQQTVASGQGTALKVMGRLPIDGTTPTIDTTLRQSLYPDRWSGGSPATADTRVDVEGTVRLSGPRDKEKTAAVHVHKRVCVRGTCVCLGASESNRLHFCNSLGDLATQVALGTTSGSAWVSFLSLRGSCAVEVPSGDALVSGAAEVVSTGYGFTPSQDVRISGKA